MLPPPLLLLSYRLRRSPQLYSLGLIQNKRLLACDKIAASTFCRRRLPVVLCRLKFAENMKEAVTLVEQGHIRVGRDLIERRVIRPKQVHHLELG